MGLNELLKVGDRIKYYRKEKGLKQKEVASMLHIPATTYSNYENNNRVPDTDILQRIAQVLGVTVWELLTPDGDVSAVVLSPDGTVEGTLTDKLLAEYVDAYDKLLDFLSHFQVVQLPYGKVCFNDTGEEYRIGDIVPVLNLISAQAKEVIRIFGDNELVPQKDLPQFKELIDQDNKK